jgi:glutaredoxin
MPAGMLTLYQAEWCPYSSRVRQRFTELGVTFAAVPVPAERADREPQAGFEPERQSGQ